MIVKKVYVCTGCGWNKSDSLPFGNLACCPDSHFVPFGEQVDNYLLAHC
jgi:hypothetical protein